MNVLKNKVNPILKKLRRILIDSTAKEGFFEGNHALLAPSPEFIKNYTKAIWREEPYKFHTSRKEPVIFDVGSNIGLAIIYFKHLYPESKITAFEADKEIVEKYLRGNLINYGIRDVRIIDKAAWTEDCSLVFHNNGRAAGSLACKIDPEADQVTVSAIRLRDYLEREDHIDFLKIDIEGAELEVLADCADQLHKVENLFVEYHGFRGKPLRCSNLLNIIEKAGFRYQLKGPAHNFEAQSFQSAYLEIDCIVEIFAKRFCSQSESSSGTFG